MKSKAPCGLNAYWLCLLCMVCVMVSVVLWWERAISPHPRVQLGQNPGIPPSSHGSTVGPPKSIGIRKHCGRGWWEEHALWGLEGLGWCCSSTMAHRVALGIPSISQCLSYLICGDASSP